MTDTVFINGEWREGEGASFQSINPATGEACFEGKAATRAEVAEAVGAARTAFPKWAMTPLEQRIENSRALSRHHQARR